MPTWYAGAVSASLLLLAGAFASGAALHEILLGVATGLLATTAMIFVVQKIIDDINRAQHAPAMLVSLSICTDIYQIFTECWFEMGRSKGLIENSTDWEDKDFLKRLQRNINLQDTWTGPFIGGHVLLGGIKTMTWDDYITLTRRVLTQKIDDVLTHHILYTDPDIIAMLYVLKTDPTSFCGHFFSSIYEGRESFNGDLYDHLKRDIYIYQRLRGRIEEVGESINHERKEMIWKRLRYGVTNSAGVW